MSPQIFPRDLVFDIYLFRPTKEIIKSRPARAGSRARDPSGRAVHNFGRTGGGGVWRPQPPRGPVVRKIILFLFYFHFILFLYF